MIYAGIDLGGSSFKVGLVDAASLVDFKNIEARSDKNLYPRLQYIAEEINNLLKKNNRNKDQLKGIGLSFPSIVDSDNNRILTQYVKYTDARKIDFDQWAKDNWGIPMALENDARAALVGEWQHGAGKAKHNILMLTLGTGVGSAVLINGQLLKGAHYLGGNLGGHMIINYKGSQCNCGLVGCLESVASGWVIPELIRKSIDPKSSLSGIELVTIKDVFEQAEIGDSYALSLQNHCLHAWSQGLINLVHAFDPELIIIGGGIMKSKEVILPFLQKELDSDPWLPARIPIVPAQFPEEAGVLGMAYLAQSKS